MSTFGCPVVQLGKIGKHPNADSLSITQVEGCPVIIRTGDFSPGDLAVYIPVDSLIPNTIEALNFLRFNKAGKHRVRAMKLRGIFSMGLLMKCGETFGYTPGADYSAALGIVKYEEPEEIGMNTGNEKDPGFMPVYDMENYRKYKHLLTLAEDVVVTEKIHGCNGRFAYRDGRLWVGSHRAIKAPDDRNMWWHVAKQYNIAEKLQQLGDASDFVLYGEVYGSVQDLKYGVKPGEYQFAAFDLFNTATGTFVDAWLFAKMMKEGLEMPMVPHLYAGPYFPEVVEPLAKGMSSLAANIREGIVIRPISERWNQETGRTIFKLVSEEYLLRNNGTEHH